MSTTKALIYHVKHKSSKSKTEIILNTDKQDNPHIVSVKLLSGKVISLVGIRQALDHFKQHIINAPDHIA